MQSYKKKKMYNIYYIIERVTITEREWSLRNILRIPMRIYFIIFFYL